MPFPCPNKNHDDFKALVEAFGGGENADKKTNDLAKERASLSYFRNGDVIPKVEDAKRLIEWKDSSSPVTDSSQETNPAGEVPPKTETTKPTPNEQESKQVEAKQQAKPVRKGSAPERDAADAEGQGKGVLKPEDAGGENPPASEFLAEDGTPTERFKELANAAKPDSDLFKVKSGEKGKPSIGVYRRLSAKSELSPEEKTDLADATKALAEKMDSMNESGITVPLGPGAKTAREGEYSAGRHLIDQLKIRPKTGKKDGKPWYVDIAQAWAKGKDAVRGAWAMAQTVAPRAKEMLEGINSIDDAKRAVLEFHQKEQTAAGLHTRVGQEMAKRFKSETTRGAAHIWSDTPGTREEKIAAINDTLANLPKDTKPEIRKVLEEAAKGGKDVVDLSEMMDDFWSEAGDKGLDADVLRQLREDYATHVWKNADNMPKQMSGMMKNGMVNESFDYAKQRKIPTILEGIKQGKEPFLDPAVIIPRYGYELDKAIASRELIEKLSGLDASDGSPLLAATGTRQVIESNKFAVVKEDGGRARKTFDTKEEAEAALKPGEKVESRDSTTVLIRPQAKYADMQGYRPVDHSSMRRWKWADTDPETGKTVIYEGELYVHPEAYQRLANMMDKYRLTPSMMMRTALNVSSELKGMKLGLPSLFHTVHVGTHDVFHWGNVFKHMATEIDPESPEVQEALGYGIQVFTPPGQISAAAEGIGSGLLVNKIPLLGPFSKAWTEFQFQKLIPRMTYGTFVNAFARAKWMRDNPGDFARANLPKFMTDKLGLFKRYTDEEIGHRIADMTNNAFGELNPLILGKNGRNPAVDRILRLAFLAPKFGEGRLRFVAKALTRTGHEERFALATMMLTLYTMARVSNQLSHGDPENDWKHAFMVKIGDKWWSMRSVIGDTTHALSDFRGFIENRLNPMTTAPMLRFWKGTDTRGRKLSDQEQIAEDFKGLAPIQVSGMFRDDKTVWDSFFQSMGASGLRESPMQDIHRLVTKWKENNADPKLRADAKKESQSVFAPSDYEPLRAAIRQDNLKHAAIEYHRLVDNKIKRPDEIFKAMNNNRPLSGSWKTESAFVKTLTGPQKQMYQRAIKQRHEEFQKFLKIRGVPKSDSNDDE